MPNIFDYNPANITPYPYWRWNKVLPAIYDDSLSQYEILSKLLYTVNEIISSENDMGTQVEQLTQLVQQLIDGEFPSGLVDYVKEIAEAAVADDIAAINEVINSMQQEIDSFEESTQGQINTIIETYSSIDSNEVGNSELETAFITNVSNQYVKNWSGLYSKVDSIYTGDRKRFCIANKNGDYLAPVLTEHNCGAAVNALPSIINMLKYIGKPNVLYGNTNSVWSLTLDTVATDMVCTEFAMLYLNGTPYELSKFNGVPNLKTRYSSPLPNDIVSYVDGVPQNGCWNGRELAYYAVTSGNYSFTQGRINNYVNTGDVLMFVDWSGELTYEYMWRENHVAVVVDKDPNNGFITLLEASPAQNAYGHGFDLVTRSQTKADGVSFLYYQINPVVGNFLVYHPNFSELNTVETLYSEKFTVASNTLGTVTNRIHTHDFANNATVPAYSFVDVTVSCSQLHDIFVSHPNLSYLAIELRGNSLASGSGFSGDDTIARNRLFRTDILNDSKYITDDIHFVGYTNVPITRIAYYVGVDGNSTGQITLTNITLDVKFLGI